jgi:hypothetical protein
MCRVNIIQYTVLTQTFDFTRDIFIQNYKLHIEVFLCIFTVI